MRAISQVIKLIIKWAGVKTGILLIGDLINWTIGLSYKDKEV